MLQHRKIKTVLRNQRPHPLMCRAKHHHRMEKIKIRMVKIKRNHLILLSRQRQESLRNLRTPRMLMTPRKLR